MAKYYTKEGFPYDDVIQDLEGEDLKVVYTPNGTPISIDDILESTTADIKAALTVDDPTVEITVRQYRDYVNYIQGSAVLSAHLDAAAEQKEYLSELSAKSLDCLLGGF